MFSATENKIRGSFHLIIPLLASLRITVRSMALHLPSPNVADDAADGVDDSARETSSAWAGGLETLDTFMERNPSVRFLRLQWLDYSSTLRTRILPVKQARKAFSQRKSVSLSKAALGLVQHTSAPGFSATGEYSLIPCFEGLRLGSREGYATVQCEFWEPTGKEVSVCPRTLLRKQVEKAESNGIEFLVGFEIEVVFMRAQLVGDGHHYGGAPINAGHAWSATRVLQKDSFMEMLEAIFRNLERAGIELQQFHAESCPDQYEFVLSPMRMTLFFDREQIRSKAKRPLSSTPRGRHLASDARHHFCGSDERRPARDAVPETGSPRLRHRGPCAYLLDAP